MTSFKRRFLAVLKEPYLVLLSSTLLGLFGIAIADHTKAQNWVFTFIVLIILMAAMYTLDPENRKNRRWVFLGLFAIMAQLVALTDLPFEGRIIAAIIVIFFFSSLTLRIIVQIVNTNRVNLHVILGAVSAYLMIGIAAGLLFVLVEVWNPNAISFSYTTEPNLHDFFFYSFVTLSTLGYGDVTPEAPIAQFLAYTLAIAGQIYMTILVAFLIGKFLTRR